MSVLQGRVTGTRTPQPRSQLQTRPLPQPQPQPQPAESSGSRAPLIRGRPVHRIPRFRCYPSRHRLAGEWHFRRPLHCCSELLILRIRFGWRHSNKLTPFTDTCTRHSRGPSGISIPLRRLYHPSTSLTLRDPDARAASPRARSPIRRRRPRSVEGKRAYLSG
jgi:hypothetical protein